MGMVNILNINQNAYFKIVLIALLMWRSLVTYFPSKITIFFKVYCYNGSLSLSNSRNQYTSWYTFFFYLQNLTHFCKIRQNFHKFLKESQLNRLNQIPNYLSTMFLFFLNKKIHKHFSKIFKTIKYLAWMQS